MSQKPPHLRDASTGRPIGPRYGRYVVLGVLLLALLLAKSAARVVPVGHRGVVFDRLRGGVQTQHVLREGLNFVNPFTTSLILFDVRSQTWTMSNARDEGQVQGADGITIKSNDGQNVDIDVSIRYRLDPAQVAVLYQTVGTDYVAKIVLPTVRSAVRDVLSEYPADDIYSEKREEIALALDDLVRQELRGRGVQVDELLLRNIQFTPEYFAAIENKQIEQQAALRKGYELEIAKAEAQVRRIEAEGEAKSNDIRGEALRANPKVIQYDYVRKAAPNVQALVVGEQDLKRGPVQAPAAPR
ncbi:MAG: prohibitin family protein [Gammaproteobacteria bacterium]|nr:prohibitin family protein [Gammaproteobacteria bacterium]